MKEKVNKNLLVQKYLANELDAIERSEFEHLLKQDRLLAAELKLQLSVDQAISDPRLEDFKTYLENLHNKHLGEKFKNRSLGYNQYLAFVASILVIITLASLFLYDNYKQESVSQYFDEFYKPYAITIVKRNQNLHSIMTKDVFKLIQFYNSKDFKQAAQILSRNEIDSFTNKELIMMTGIIHLELNNFELANDQFKRVLEADNELFKLDAYWYLALTYLKANEINKAKIWLIEIVKENSFYSKRATKLLKKLK